MTYLQFHLLFNAPLLVALWLAPGRAPFGPEHAMAVVIVCAIVFVFTAPWDNYAIAKGIWGFPKEKILFRIAWCPIEEYAFFFIQTFQAILLIHVLRPFLPPGTGSPLPLTSPDFLIPGVLIGVAWLVLGRCLPNRFGAGTRFHYAFHLLYWFLPVLFFQWALAWPLFLGHAPMILLATLLLGMYLCAADMVAIRNGIWFFDPHQLTGHKLFRVLPWEEAVFFFLTTLIVAQSYLMFLPRPG